MNKKNEIRKRKDQNNKLEAINKENEKIEGFFAVVFFLGFLGVCQVIGYIFDIEPLIFIIRTRTGSSLSFWLIIPALIFSLTIYKVLKKLSYMNTLINAVKKLALWLKKYPNLYRVARFAFNHPIWSYFIAWLVYTVIEIFLYYVIKI